MGDGGPIEALDAGSGIICVVGAGGKSTLIRHLADVHPGRVAITSSVDCGRLPGDPGSDWLFGEEAELLERLPAAAVGHRVTAYSGPRCGDGRYRGVRPALIAKLHALMGVDVTNVEADAAEGCLISALADGEPALVPGIRLVVSVMSVQALGEPLDARSAQRPELVAEITGARLEEPIEVPHLARLAAHQFRALRRQTDAAICPLFNMVDGVPPEAAAEIPAAAIGQEPAIKKFAYSCLALDPPVLEGLVRSERNNDEMPADEEGEDEAAPAPLLHALPAAGRENGGDERQTGYLIDTLAARSGIVCVVGAGGKKTLIGALVESHPGRVAVTCTARMAPIPPALTPHWLAGEEAELRRELPAAPADWRVIAYTGPLGRSERYEGVRPELVAELHARMGVAATFVKADGARMRWIKGHKPDEPPLVPATATILSLLSIRAIGRPLDERCAHRPELVAEITGAALGETVTPRHLARLLVHQYRCLKEVSQASVIPIVNMADDEAQLDLAKELVVSAFVEDDDIERILITSFAADPPLLLALVR